MSALEIEEVLVRRALDRSRRGSGPDAQPSAAGDRQESDP
jgi:hypothetical protein